jgi:AraC-like DNA-binding protein
MVVMAIVVPVVDVVPNVLPEILPVVADLLCHLLLAQDPISVADVAEVAGASARTLFRELRKRHGIGPRAFLKARRLEAAQRALLAADPRERPVTDIVLDYGFCHFGRFSVEYKRTFQESPPDTLRR